MMQGSIKALIGHSHLVSQMRVLRVLSSVAPMVRTNPIPYLAPYFGFKAHSDQNEKIGKDYGYTHVLMIDGSSRLIVGYISIPMKSSS